VRLGPVDLRVWAPRAALIAAFGAMYYLAVHLGWLPPNPIEWLLNLGEQLRAELPRYGALAPLVYVALYAGQIVLAPLPGAALAYTAGYLFGPIAAVYSMAGILIGAAVGFELARRLGYPVVEKLAPKSWLDRWRNLSAVNSEFTWFLLMLAPTADVFYFIAGLTTLRFRRFFLIVLLGRTPGIILSSLLGANLETFGVQWVFILIGGMLVIALAGNWLRQRVERRALLSAQGIDPERPAALD
jgi:uncharacterized membrane protein YdjX (TVP38/TMEM64 family)